MLLTALRTVVKKWTISWLKHLSFSIIPTFPSSLFLSTLCSYPLSNQSSQTLSSLLTIVHSALFWLLLPGARNLRHCLNPGNGLAQLWRVFCIIGWDDDHLATSSLSWWQPCCQEEGLATTLAVLLCFFSTTPCGHSGRRKGRLCSRGAVNEHHWIVVGATCPGRTCGDGGDWCLGCR